MRLEIRPRGCVFLCVTAVPGTLVPYPGTLVPYPGTLVPSPGNRYEIPGIWYGTAAVLLFKGGAGEGQGVLDGGVPVFQSRSRGVVVFADVCGAGVLLTTTGGEVASSRPVDRGPSSDDFRCTLRVRLL